MLFDYVSTQDFGNIVAETFNTEKTHMQFSHELLKQRIKIYVYDNLYIYAFVPCSC